MKNGINKLVITNFMLIPDDYLEAESISIVDMLHSKALCMVFTNGTKQETPREAEMRKNLLDMGVWCRVFLTMQIGGVACWKTMIDEINDKIQERGDYWQIKVFDKIRNSTTSMVSYESYGGVPVKEIHESITQSVHVSKLLDVILEFCRILAKYWKYTTRVHGDLHTGNILAQINNNVLEKLNVIDVEWLQRYYTEYKSIISENDNDFAVFLFAVYNCYRKETIQEILGTKRYLLEVTLFVAFCLESSPNKSLTQKYFEDEIRTRQKFYAYVYTSHTAQFFKWCLDLFGTSTEMYTDNTMKCFRKLMERA